MKLSVAIDIYVHDRHVSRSTFVNGEAILRSVCRRIGNVYLSTITAASFAVYLSNPHISVATRRGQSSILKGFLRFWASRNAIAAFTLPAQPRAEVTFNPHLYTADQVRDLLEATGRSQHGSGSIRADTLRMFLLMLYATGASVGEVLELQVCDFSFKCTHVTFRNQNRRGERRIPLCRDLQRELSRYIARKAACEVATSSLFCTESGHSIDSTYLKQCFRRLQRSAVPNRPGSEKRAPRMQDFRATFAVERLRSWIKQGADLHRLLPALSTYMGYSHLSGADKYLSLVPERFTADLKNLSPARHRKLLRNDPIYRRTGDKYDRRKT